MKKVLIILYYWPPAGGPGVQRWLKFCKYLPEFGVQPILYLPENPDYPLRDESLLKEVPENIQILRTKIWEPYALAKKFSKDAGKFQAGQFDKSARQSWKNRLSVFIRGNFFIPDARVFWVKPSVKFVQKFLEKDGQDIQTIITTGPPHSLHLIGFGLKKIFPEKKWLADFRDPWTEISYFNELKLSHWARKKHQQLEKKVFQSADITIATSFADAENFREKGAHAITITNGFDEADFSETSPPKTDNIFRITYSGVLEQLRNPLIFWESLENFLAKNPQYQENLELAFVGKVDEKILTDLKKYRFFHTIKLYGYLSHAESLKILQISDALLITNFPDEKHGGILPGKLYEYLAVRKPIISIGPKHADAEIILNETQSGPHFSAGMGENLEKYLAKLFSRDFSLHANEMHIAKYSRRELTAKLANIIA